MTIDEAGTCYNIHLIFLGNMKAGDCVMLSKRSWGHGNMTIRILNG